MGTQISLKAVLPLAEGIATASGRCNVSNTESVVMQSLRGCLVIMDKPLNKQSNGLWNETLISDANSPYDRLNIPTHRVTPLMRYEIVFIERLV